MNANETTEHDTHQAQRELDRDKPDLAHRLSAVSRSSKQMVERTLSQTRPLIAGVAAIGAAAAVLGLYKIARARRRKGWIVPPEKPSVFGNMARAALTSAAASLAGYLMERLQRTLDTHIEPQHLGQAEPSAAGSASHS